MKNFIQLSILVIALAVVSSCSKDSEGISTVTDLPTFTLTGGPLYVTSVQPAGSSFVDPGVVALAGETEVPVTTTGSVDVSTPGIYQLHYSAKDVSGQFEYATDRKVFVAAQGLSVNYAGAYKASGRANTMAVAQQVDGVLGWYRASDSWFQASKIPVEFIDLGTSLKVIPGTSPYGPHDGTITYNAETKTLTFKMVITSGGNAGVGWTTNWILQ